MLLRDGITVSFKLVKCTVWQKPIRPVQVQAGADWLHFGRVANHGPAPCKRGHRRNLSKRPIWTGPRRAGGRGVKAAPIGKHTGPHHDLAGRPRLHWHLSNNASPPLIVINVRPQQTFLKIFTWLRNTKDVIHLSVEYCNYGQ